MTTENIDRRPLVTFALFAYNQDRYIREAIEGAFSQTYEPLEIILSDDCSTDRTFEIMQEMAASYKGPHEVRVRRNEVNVGIIDHVIRVGIEARGKLFIVAAGDDISKPDRSSALCECWLQSEPAVLISDHDVISDDGSLLSINLKYSPLGRFQHVMQACQQAKRYDGMVRNIPGYCAAYDTSFVAETPLAHERLFNEDALFSYLANFEGRHIEYVQKSLLLVRLAATSVSVREIGELSYAEIRIREKKIESGAGSKLRFFFYLQSICSARQYDNFDEVWAALKSHVQENQLVLEYYSCPRLTRIQRMLTGKTKSHRRFAAIRIFGATSLLLLAHLRRISGVAR